MIDKNKRKVHGIKFEYGDIINGTDYPSESFDKILFLEVIEHLPKNTEKQALKEIHRLLKKGGTMVLSTPNDTLLTAIFDPAYWLIGHRHYKINDIKKMLRDSGFTIESDYIGGGVAELLWIPFFYILLKLKLDKPITPIINRFIDREYRTKGFYTIIIKCTK
ncbi:MAG TPA: class I SAM-dependent methyltransferase [bacterium]|nr:class I SAM-dependent methyltransferase [bacterium]